MATHDFYKIKRRIGEFGLAALDGRTGLAKAVRGFREDLLADIPGEPAATQRALVDVVVAEWAIVSSIDAWLLDNPDKLIQGSKLADVVRERQTVANGFCTHLVQLGLEPRTLEKVVSIEDKLRARIAG